MRLWTLHPKYLDPQGLVALWREALLAQAVLHGATRGYRHHPQLERFKQQPDALRSIAAYLQGVADEARQRDYVFDVAKIRCIPAGATVAATHGQIMYEWQHLLAKLRGRSPDWYAKINCIALPDPHPLFHLVDGGMEVWEKAAQASSRRG